MKQFLIILFFTSSVFVRGQIWSWTSCSQTVAPNQIFYPNSISTGTPMNGVRQYLCGPNTVVYDTTKTACWYAFVNTNCTLTVNSNCPGPQVFWLKSGAVLNVGPKASTPFQIYYESGAIINNPFSISIGPTTCSNVAFPSPNCATVINENTLKGTIFLLYPNPATSKINIEFRHSDNPFADVVITNQLGEIALERKQWLIADKEIPIDNLSNGSYFIQVKTKFGLQTEKLIIIR